MGSNPNHDLSWLGGEGGKSKYDEDMGGTAICNYKLLLKACSVIFDTNL